MEQLLYHLWKHALYDNKPPMLTTAGVTVEVVDPGIHNRGMGPDFFNAKIRYGGEMWAGNVEIHVRSSDWYAHKHDENPLYDSVILSVVMAVDCDVMRTTGSPIDQLEIVVPARVANDYASLIARPERHAACPLKLDGVSRLLVTDWIGALGMERIIAKSNRIHELVRLYSGDWEQTLYVLLARSFGTGVNADPFERVARSLPLNFLRKHGNSLLQTEAMLFGQAGFLENSKIEHPYYLLLQREYAFLRRKFGLTPLPTAMWNFARLRPAAFPQVRIAAFASLLYHYPRLFTHFIEARSARDVKPMFDAPLSPFWDDHYRFAVPSAERVKHTGFLTIETIIINTLAPLLFAYAAHTGNYLMEERAIDILEDMRPENNMYVRAWRDCGIAVRNAFESQAVIQLQREYCEKKKCLFCRFGHQLLARRE